MLDRDNHGVATSAGGGAVTCVGMFGSLRVTGPDRTLGPRDFGGVKPKQLLEMLLLERGRAVAKDDLADRLWGESLPSDVSATVETYISLLRRRLPSGRQLIVTDSRGYRLAADQVSVDLDSFDRLAQLGVTGQPAERYAHLSDLVALGGEPVLADEPYAEWALPVRRQYAERHSQALVQLAECCVALGELDEAANRAKTALAADPLLERACRAAMVAYYSMGAQAEALRIYAETRAALASELGVVPMAETVLLHDAVLRQAPPETLLDAVPGRPPAIRFASNGSARLAFQSFGAGSHDIVFVPPMETHLGATWDEPVYAAFLRRLAGLGRVTIFDKRGSGLSDPVLEWPSEQERSEDLAAVLDAAGVERPVLVGVCDGGVRCVRFAVRYPDRVGALVLVGVPARLLRSDDFEWGWPERFYRLFLDSFEDAWTRGVGMEVMNPSIARDPRYRALYARFLRLGASPGMARRLREEDLDIRPVLADISAPALVLSRVEDPWVRVENSRYLADHLSNAELCEVPGADHEPWLGDIEPVVSALQSFIDRLPVPAGAEA